MYAREIVGGVTIASVNYLKIPWECNLSSKSFFSTIVDHPWKVICFWIAVTVGVSYFLQFVSPSISYKDLFGENNSRLIQYERLQSEYSNDESILFLVEAKNGNAFTPELLSGIEKLTNDLWETPYSVRIDSITNHQHTEASGDDLEVKDMFKDVKKMNYEILSQTFEVRT